MAYLSRFDDRAKLYSQYRAVFEKEEVPCLAPDEYLDSILLLYQKYYREVFYLGMDTNEAEEKLKERVLDLFSRKDSAVSFGEIEENLIAGAFESRGYAFLGGRTGGYYGPYIWKSTELKCYDVELPDGVREYSVRLLDGFISKSWLDYLSFGRVGTGGWTDGDGLINCIASSYDFEDESFTVSLLKHEAQHAQDLQNVKGMSSEDLEYRAKLVELIYSRKRNLLPRFAHEAGDAGADNGHSLASRRIVEAFRDRLNMSVEELGDLPLDSIQSTAQELFCKSNEEIVYPR